MVLFNGPELWDNGPSTSQTGYFIHSPLARAIFDTEATSVEADLYGNYLLGPGTTIQIWVNGLPYATPELAEVSGPQAVTQTLPAGLKRVEIVASSQSLSTGSIRGVFLVGCTFNDTATLIPPEAPSRVVVYGDSNSTVWPTIFRSISSRSIVVEAASGRQLRHDIPDATSRAAFVAKIAAMKPAIIWIAMGVNDFVAGIWDAATFGTNYGLLLDALRAALPNTRIYCATPLMKHVERMNSPARHLESYRQAIRALIWPRSEWATLVEGPAILGLNDMESEGGEYIHHNAQGARKYAETAEAIMNGKTLVDQPPSFGETEAVSWTSTVNVSVTGNSLQKNGGSNNAADAGGTSGQKILAGPWWVRFAVIETTKTRVFGVSSVASGTAITDVLYGWAPQATNVATPWQAGTSYGYGDTASYPGIVAGVQFQVRCDGTHVYYDTIRNGELVTTRKASRPIEATDYPLYVRGIILGSSGTIADAKMHGPLG